MEASPETIHVQKIHLLVHPGFIASQYDGHPDAEVRQTSDALLTLYLEKAHTLSETEPLVVFGYASEEEFERHHADGSSYAQFIDQLQALLRDRMILIHDIESIQREDLFDHVSQLLAAKGYSIDAEVAVEAFGESGSKCVLDCAQCFHRTGSLQKPVQVNLDLTEFGVRDLYDYMLPMLLSYRNDLNLVFSLNGSVTTYDDHDF